MVGARAFGYFALLKVTRRKAATLSGRYGSNGYLTVPQRFNRGQARCTKACCIASELCKNLLE